MAAFDSQPAALSPPSSHIDPDTLPHHTDKDARHNRSPASALTPPTSEDMDPKPTDNADASSVLSDPEEEGDLEEIKPDHYYGDGKVPVFKPVSLDRRTQQRAPTDKLIRLWHNSAASSNSAKRLITMV